jgi:hypothetical protein
MAHLEKLISFEYLKKAVRVARTRFPVLKLSERPDELGIFEYPRLSI